MLVKMSNADVYNSFTPTVTRHCSCSWHDLQTDVIKVIKGHVV